MRERHEVFVQRSLPPREAWIEIIRRMGRDTFSPSLPPREAWIEITGRGRKNPQPESLPPREAWIEMLPAPSATHVAAVASPTGSVD